jgi:type II secretory pathway pseudopilin PulG
VQHSPTFRPTTRDRGVSLVEIVVSITLLGLVASSVFGVLISGIVGSSRHRDQATALAWLQSAADHLETIPLELCGDTASIVAAYQDSVRENVANGAGWASTRIAVSDVMFWNGTAFVTTCTDTAQRVRLTATSPDGKVTQTLEVVKGTPSGTPPVEPPDPFIACTVTSVSFIVKKTNTVQTSPTIVLKLKKPSTTKPSELKDKYVDVKVTTTGNCNGELRIRYKYPHKTHFHWRTIKLKAVKGAAGTYVGKFGHRHDKYLAGAKLDVVVEQGRAKRKAWGVVINGTMNQLVTLS